MLSADSVTLVLKPTALDGDDAQNAIVVSPVPFTRIFCARAVSAQHTAMIAAMLPYKDTFPKFFSVFTIMRSTLLETPPLV